MVSTLQPNPKPGRFAAEVNVNELNRIIRELSTRLDEVGTKVDDLVVRVAALESTRRST